MDNTEQLISIYHTGFTVCTLLLIAGIAMAVLFFFMFDIRNIFRIRTGRAKQQTISEMQERNLKTGKLSIDSPYTESGELKPKERKRNTGAFRIPGRKGADEQKPKPLVAPASGASVATEQIGMPAPAAPSGGPSGSEASAAPAAAMETSVLEGGANASPFPSGTPASGPVFSPGAASIPTPAEPYGAPMETSVLAEPAPQTAGQDTARGFRFEITERILVVHTAETIS